ncbi:hypothetical protein NDU88_001075 [Pleurodeles waltl]|uniref:Uncharacterized protein n=1 Tax=Pleurodeles waltl TaxID=8319 RepID=A0AAV7MMG2_PLEWA|nr:hypothetical protein NDU88_001075 [Pleurodeles waltl]
MERARKTSLKGPKVPSPAAAGVSKCASHVAGVRNKFKGAKGPAPCRSRCPNTRPAERARKTSLKGSKVPPPSAAGVQTRDPQSGHPKQV